MLLVIDANVLFSSLISNRICLRIFELNRLFKKFEFIAPEFLLFEISNRIDKILKFTKFTREEFEEVFSLIEE
jgi:predicted nucleic acid-binding protein